MDGLTEEVAKKFIERYEEYNKVKFSKEAVEEFIANVNSYADSVAFWASQRAKLRDRTVNIREVDEATELTDILVCQETVLKKLDLEVPENCRNFLVNLPNIAKKAMDLEMSKEERKFRKNLF